MPEVQRHGQPVATHVGSLWLANVAHAHRNVNRPLTRVPLSPGFFLRHEPARLNGRRARTTISDAARFAEFAHPTDLAQAGNGRTGTASRAVPDEEWRKWTRNQAQAAPRSPADIY